MIAKPIQQLTFEIPMDQANVRTVQFRFTDSQPLQMIVTEGERLIHVEQVTLSDDEISQLWGVSRARIWQLHQRAIKKLRTAMANDSSFQSMSGTATP